MLTQQQLFEVLERSADWYLVLQLKDDKLITCYANQIMRTNCQGTCLENALTFGENFSSCPAFSKLYDTAITVAKTKTSVHIPEFIFTCHNSSPKFLDLQVYTNNGHVVICGRDLEPVLYNLRKSTALLNEKLDEMLETNKGATK